MVFNIERSGVSVNSNKLIHRNEREAEREIIRSVIERYHEEHSKCVRKGRNVAWPFRHLSSCGRSVLAAGVCSVRELRYQTSYLNTTEIPALLTQASLSFIEWVVIKQLITKTDHVL